jgi:hypothetical protein
MQLPCAIWSGTAHIANLSDRIAGVYYRILWQHTTDRVRLQGPRR